MATMVCVGVISGLCSAGVLALINRVLQQRHDQASLLALGFVAVVSGKLAAQIMSQLTLTRFAQDTTLDLSLRLSEKILTSPYRRTESYGHANILVTLTDDVSMLAWSVQCLPQLAMNVAIVVGCGVYLLWLSWATFLLVVTATLLGAWGYHWLHTRAFSTINASREARAQLFKHFRSLTEGIKELALHRQRRAEFLAHDLRGAADLYRQTSIDAARQYAMAEGWSHFAFYSMIGVILFVFPLMLPLSTESLIGYVVVLLYMMSPIWGIIGILPTIERGQVAFEKIQRLGVSLDEFSESLHCAVAPVPVEQQASLLLNSVTFRYATDGQGNDPFALGPISLKLGPGELSFVIGGNGSGKSTFVKLLAGLYVPDSGEMSLNGTVISDVNRDWYREHFSVVFSDFYLFDKLLGIEDDRIQTSAAAYLSSLELDHKVEVRDRAFSTVDLSQGQRKRLALLTAYLEDRPVYVFDEWAADQDPQYKDVFYLKLLPELRARGKSVVVITHDDRYFHLGDRVVKLENGKVVPS